MRKTLSTFLVVLLYLPISMPVQALAVSEVQLESFLNQPLDARIFLLSVEDNELISLNVDVKYTDDKVGNQRYAELRYEIKEDGRGHYINITSSDVIREPILQFVLELNWSEGRMIREYSLLIDPQ